MAEQRPLTPKQERFCEEYLIDLNATQAAIRAGYSEKNAGKIGFQLIEKTRIQAALKEAQAALSQRTQITQDRVLREYAKLGFFDPRKLFNGDGSPVPIQDLDDDTAAAIAGLDVLEVYEGTGADRVFTGYIKKYKIANKIGALDSMAKHLGLFIDRQEITGPDGGPLQMQVSRIAGMTETELDAARKLLAEDDDDSLDVLPEITD